MAENDSELRELGTNVSRVIGLALVVIAISEGAIAGVVTQLVQGDVDAGVAEYIEFGQLYLATFLLSATLTGVFASWEVPKLYGIQPSPWVPLLVLVGGATLTGLPVIPEGGTPAGWAYGALATFAEHYGVNFFAGLVTGIAGGFIVALVAEYLQKKTRPRGTP